MQRKGDRKIDLRGLVTVIGQLNEENTVLLSEIEAGKEVKSSKFSDKESKLFIIKRIAMKTYPSPFLNNQYSILKRLYLSPGYFLKPYHYDFRDNFLSLCSRVQSNSLQSIIWAHKHDRSRMSRSILYTFAVRMYENIAKIRQNDLFHQNLKPSNIFCEINNENGTTLSWLWSYAAIYTNYRNPYYCKIGSQAVGKSSMGKSSVGKSSVVQIYVQEIEYYALGVMLLEMATPHTIEYIAKMLQNYQDYFSYVKDYYGGRLATMIRNLIDYPKDNTFSMPFQDFENEEEKEEYDRNKYDYQKSKYITDFLKIVRKYEQNEYVFERMLRNKGLVHIIYQISDTIHKRNISASSILEELASIDPYYDFQFSSMTQMEKLLNYFDILLDQKELMFICTYYAVNSQIKYFRLLQKVFQPRYLIENIILKSLESYDNSLKSFFEAMAERPEVWTLSEVKDFLIRLDVYYKDQDLNEVLRSWNSSAYAKKKSNTEIKYEDMYKVLKPNLMKTNTSQFGRSSQLNTSIINQSTVDGNKLKEIFKQIESKDHELLTFFRSFDYQSNWFVDFKIYKYIRKIVTAKEYTFRQAFITMWELGTMPDYRSKRLNYIYLLKNMYWYSNLDLLRKVLTIKINESNSQMLFDKYAIYGKGWKLQSLIQFNIDEKLEFDERELRTLFDEFDSDGSRFIYLVYLVGKLTGLIAFDYYLIVYLIKKYIKSHRVDMFSYFLAKDQRCKLLLQNANDLDEVLKNIGVEISSDHCLQLFDKFAKKGKFEYLKFLMVFEPNDKIFLMATKLIIREYYKDDFEKFYKLGLAEGKKKWERGSLARINYECVLGFYYNQLGEVWYTLAKGYLSLTKYYVADIYKYDVYKTNELTRKNLSSLADLVPEKSNKPVSYKDIASNKALASNRDNNEIEKNEFYKEIIRCNVYEMLTELVRASRGVGKLELEMFFQVLYSLKIKAKRTYTMKAIANFKQLYSDKKMYVNYVNLLFLIVERQNYDILRDKASIIIYIINYVKKYKRINNEDIFKLGRRADIMKFKDFESSIKELLETEIYFADLEEIWDYWEQPEYLILADFDRILKNNRGRRYKSGKERYKSNKKKAKSKNGIDDIEYVDFEDNMRDIEDKRKRDGREKSNSKYDDGYYQYYREAKNDKYSKQKDKYNTRSIYERDKQEYEKNHHYRGNIKKGNYHEREDEYYYRNQHQKGSNKKNSYYERQSEYSTPNDWKRYYPSDKDHTKDRRKKYNERSYDRYEREEEPMKSKLTALREYYRYRYDKDQKSDDFNEDSPKTPYLRGRGSFGRDYDNQEMLKPKRYSYTNKPERDNSKSKNSNTKYFRMDTFNGQQDQKDNGLSEERRMSKLKDKLEHYLADRGIEAMNNLFLRGNTIDKRLFKYCLINNYGFKSVDAEYLVESLQKFNKIKLENVKKYFKTGRDSRDRETSPQYYRGNRSTQEKRTSKRGRMSYYPKYGRKYQEGYIDEKGRKITNPRRQKLNAPLIKYHIKMLVDTFCKKFDIGEFEHYFFETRERISREDFIRKSQGINNSISSNMYEKIFDYLVPTPKDEITTLAFKLKFPYSSNAELDYYYLPEELERYLKLIFEKADKDKSGYIYPNYIEFVLSSLGMNQTQKEIQYYFNRIDSDFDNKISFKYFKLFIEDNIIPLLCNFDEDIDELQRLLKMNDLLNTGTISLLALQGVIENFGVKLSYHYILLLGRSITCDGDSIYIRELLAAIKYPSNPLFSASLKTVLYKIRLRRKVYLKDIQKVFSNIASSFLVAYTADVIRKQVLTCSSCFYPMLHDTGLIYEGYYYEDIRKVAGSNKPNLVSELKTSDLVVYIRLEEACGVPIPQNNEVRAAIVRRYLNVTFFDLSSEISKHAICQIYAEWDNETDDRWFFDKNNRSIFIKIGNYEPRKYYKIVLLFEFIISICENNRILYTSCGSCSMSLKDLYLSDSKVNRKLKLIAGIPSRSKEISKDSVSKRKGWKSFIGSAYIDSEMEITIQAPSKFKYYTAYLAAFPTICIINRRAVNYLWTFRYFFAEKSLDGLQIDPYFASDFRVRTFLLSLDIPDVYPRVMLFWKEKVKYINFYCRDRTIKEAKEIMNVLLIEMHLIISSKQFELLPAVPSLSTLANKSLLAMRVKMLNEIFDNIETWINNGVGNPYRRKKNYGYSYYPLYIQYRDFGKEHRALLDSIYKMSIK